MVYCARKYEENLHSQWESDDATRSQSEETNTLCLSRSRPCGGVACRQQPLAEAKGLATHLSTHETQGGDNRLVDRAAQRSEGGTLAISTAHKQKGSTPELLLVQTETWCRSNRCLSTRTVSHIDRKLSMDTTSNRGESADSAFVPPPLQRRGLPERSYCEWDC